MLVSNGVLSHRFEENLDAPFRLGRHQELDGRSLDYLFEKTLAKPISIKPVEHLPNLTTLNQGQVGSCTGNAGTYALGSLFGQSGIVGVTLDGLGLTSYDAAANEKFALALYHEATVQDGFPGTYPPDDSGSSGLGVCRALKAAGQIGSYVWVTTWQAIGSALQRQGLMIGMPWYNSFFHPDVQGFIDSGNWQSSGIAGGHELYIEALEAWNGRVPGKSVIRLRNSWSDSWGDHGCGRMRLSTYVALKQQIDVKQLVAK